MGWSDLGRSQTGWASIGTEATPALSPGGLGFDLCRDPSRRLVRISSETERPILRPAPPDRRRHRSERKPTSVTPLASSRAPNRTLLVWGAATRELHSVTHDRARDELFPCNPVGFPINPSKDELRRIFRRPLSCRSPPAPITLISVLVLRRWRGIQLQRGSQEWSSTRIAISWRTSRHCRRTSTRSTLQPTPSLPRSACVAAFCFPDGGNSLVGPQQLPQLPTWLVRFVFALAVVFGL